MQLLKIDGSYGSGDEIAKSDGELEKEFLDPETFQSNIYTSPRFKQNQTLATERSQVIFEKDEHGKFVKDEKNNKLPKKRTILGPTSSFWNGKK